MNGIKLLDNINSNQGFSTPNSKQGSFNTPSTNDTSASPNKTEYFFYKETIENRPSQYPVDGEQKNLSYGSDSR